jgi:antitoxin HigA-1
MVKKLNDKYPVENIKREFSAADTVKETLEYYKITQKEFAFRLGISQAHVSDILNRRKFMSEELALKIEQVTGISAELLLRMDFNYQMEQIDSLRNKLPELERYEWALEG